MKTEGIIQKLTKEEIELIKKKEAERNTTKDILK